MDTIEVTAIATHHGDYGTIKAGDKYTTDRRHAQELVNNGLVTAPGIESTGKKAGFVQDITVNEEANYKKGDIHKEKAENKTANVPTAKKK